MKEYKDIEKYDEKEILFEKIIVDVDFGNVTLHA